jgi:hypothetical protein
MLWEYLVAARQDCLLRLAGCERWDQFLEMRGELNALNVMIEFGDKLLDALEDARHRVGEDDARRRGTGGYR